MKRRTNCLRLLFVLLCALASCQREAFEGDDASATANVNLEVTTRATGTDDAIVRLRLIVTGWNSGGSGSVSFNRLSDSPGTSGFTVKARKGDNNFYIIANETPTMTTALNALKTAADIEAFRINFLPAKAGDVPVMFGVCRQVAVNAADKDATATVTYTDDDGNRQTNRATLPLSVRRAAARFSLAFVKNSDAFRVKNLNFKLLRIPAYYCLGEETYPGTQWSAETLPQSSTAELNSNNTATWNGTTREYSFGSGDKVIFDDFYLPEHLPTDTHRGEADYATVLIANGTCVTPGGREQDANWRIDLMADNFRILRNTHYKIAARIEGMGAMGMSAEVMPVTEHDIPVNWDIPDGLAVVSDREPDYGRNVSVANDVTAYSGLLKVVKTTNGTATYSDVLFKYGSLIGVSAATGGSGTSYQPATDVIYDPSLTGNTYTLSTWTGIPLSTSDRTGQDNTLAGLRDGQGDPCQLVGITIRQMEQGRYSNGLWHTATPEEMTRLGINGDTRTDGTTTADSRGLRAFHSLLLPITTYRDNGGILSSANARGYYLSARNGRGFTFDAANPTAAGESDFSSRSQGAYTVRCVRNTIPATTLKCTASSVGYQGGDFTIRVTSNIPYWKAELVTAANNNGDVSGSIDVSGITFATATGGFDGVLSGTAVRRVLQSDRKIYVRLTGTGYDGTTAKQIVSVLQNKLEWKGVIEKNTMPERIPTAGGTYSATILLSPQDKEALPADATCTLTIRSGNAVLETIGPVSLDRDPPQATLSYTVPSNTLPDIRGITLSFVITGTELQCKTETSKIQEKN